MMLGHIVASLPVTDSQIGTFVLTMMKETTGDYRVIYGIVITRYECDIIFITRVRGKAEDKGNKNDITQVNGLYPSEPRHC